jgi:hypothetical protein
VPRSQCARGRFVWKFIPTVADAVPGVIVILLLNVGFLLPVFGIFSKRNSKGFGSPRRFMRVRCGCSFRGVDCCCWESLGKFLNNLGDMVNFVVVAGLDISHCINNILQPPGLVVDVL